MLREKGGTNSSSACSHEAFYTSYKTGVDKHFDNHGTRRHLPSVTVVPFLSIWIQAGFPVGVQ